MLWRVCKGYTILSYTEVDESLADLDTVSSPVQNNAPLLSFICYPRGSKAYVQVNRKF